MLFNIIFSYLLFAAISVDIIFIYIHINRFEPFS